MFFIGFIVGALFGMITLGVIACVMVSNEEKRIVEEFKNE